MKKLFLIIRTIIHLQPVQIQYQIWYRLRKIWRKITGFGYLLSIEKQAEQLTFTPWIEKPVSLTDKGFTFLNLTFEQEFLPKKEREKLNIP